MKEQECETFFWESCSTEAYRSPIQCEKRTFLLGTFSGELTLSSSLSQKPSCEFEWKAWEGTTTSKSQWKRWCLRKDKQAWSAFEEETDSAAGGLKPTKPSVARTRILDCLSLYFLKVGREVKMATLGQSADSGHKDHCIFPHRALVCKLESL